MPLHPLRSEGRKMWRGSRELGYENLKGISTSPCGGQGPSAADLNWPASVLNLDLPVREYVNAHLDSSPAEGSSCWWRWPDTCSSTAHRPKSLSRWSTWWGRAGGCSALTHCTDTGSGAPPVGQSPSIHPVQAQQSNTNKDSYAFYGWGWVCHLE